MMNRSTGGTSRSSRNLSCVMTYSVCSPGSCVGNVTTLNELENRDRRRRVSSISAKVGTIITIVRHRPVATSASTIADFPNDVGAERMTVTGKQALIYLALSGVEDKVSAVKMRRTMTLECQLLLCAHLQRLIDVREQTKRRSQRLQNGLKG